MILCLESSADPTVIGLVVNGNLVMENVFSERDRFAGEVETMLRDMNIPPDRLSAIAIGIGPGSFTGLRVSLAFAKGFARGVNLPIWPVSSLAVIAANLQGRWDNVAVISPARRGKAHYAHFTGETMDQEGNATVFAYEDLPLHMTADMALVGPGVAKIEGPLRKQLSAYIPADDSLHRPHVLELARLAREEWLERTPPDVGTLVPVYGLDFPV